MTTLSNAKPRATQLLKRLLSAPDLVNIVRALPAERLGALVHDVGLEDAGELIALATTDQLQALFDDDLWKSGEDAEERFDAERFALWLEVLFEAGEVVVVQRLVELPREFLCLAVAHLAYVIDMDLLLNDVEMDERYHERVERALDSAASEEWEEFRLVDRGRGGFDVLVMSLLALDTEHSPMLRDVLERCCDLTTTEVEARGGLVKALSRLEAAEESMRGARHERRTERGFVSLADARSFARLVVDDLKYDTGRDPFTHAYFRDVYGKKRANSDLKHAANPPRPAQKLVDALREELEARPKKPADSLSTALELLRARNAEAYDQRVAELVYLANVLVTVSEPEQRRLRPIEASEAVVRACAAGIDVLGFAAQSSTQLASTLETLLLDLVFRAGWARFASEVGDADPVAALLRHLATQPRATEH